jgi:hypothetical protein
MLELDWASFYLLVTSNVGYLLSFFSSKIGQLSIKELLQKRKINTCLLINSAKKHNYFLTELLNPELWFLCLEK